MIWTLIMPINVLEGLPRNYPTGLVPNFYGIYPCDDF